MRMRRTVPLRTPSATLHSRTSRARITRAARHGKHFVFNGMEYTCTHTHAHNIDAVTPRVCRTCSPYACNIRGYINISQMFSVAVAHVNIATFV